MYELYDLVDDEVFVKFTEKEALVNALERYASQYPMFILDLGVRAPDGTCVEARSLLS